MNTVDALRDKRLFGKLPAFRDLSTWARWVVFLKAIDGLSLDADEEQIFCEHTGRSRYMPPAGGFSESVAITGRQSGKTIIAAAIADVEALRSQRELDGTDLFAVLIAQDQRGALRTIFRYATAPFGLIGSMKRIITAQRADTLTLSNGVTVAAYPCRPAAVRGLRACVVVLDELAFYTSAEGNAVDREMLRAVRPCLATTGGKLVILSSPYGQSGALWDLHRQHYGRDDSTTLVWQAAAPQMNPTLPRDYLARMADDDPEAYRSEVLGEFRAGLTTFLDPNVLDACVDADVHERPWVSGVNYVAGFDASGGRGDATALAVAHPTGDGRATLDVVRTWPGRHNPAHAIREACDVLKLYRITSVSGDSFASGFVENEFREHGIAYQPVILGEQRQDRSRIYLELLPLVNTARIRLLDHLDLLRELRGLERRRGATRDRVDHRPGGHDDAANVAAIALVLAVGGTVSDPSVARGAIEATLAAPSPLATTARAFYNSGVGSLEERAFGSGAAGGAFDLGKRGFGR